MNSKYGIFTSSQDPEQLSLSVQSAFKVLLGIAGAFAAWHSVDAITVTSVLQQMMDIVITLIPIAYSTYHSLELFWGLGRKLFNLFTKSKSQASATTAIVPPQQ